MHRIPIKSLLTTLEACQLEQKIPCFIDPSGRVDLFFQYSQDYHGFFIDSKEIIVETLIKKAPKQRALDFMAHQWENAQKEQRPLVIALQDTAMDLKQWTHPRFPFSILNPSSHSSMVILISHLNEEGFQTHLQNVLPMDWIEPILIQTAETPKYDR